MIMQLRIQRSAGAMPVPNPQHTLRINHRDTGLTGACVRDPWRQRIDCLKYRVGVCRLDRCHHTLIAEGVQHAHRLRRRERQIERRHRTLRHRWLAEPAAIRRGLRLQQQPSLDRRRHVASNSTHEIRSANPTARSVAVTGVVVLSALYDSRLVIAGIRRADLADAQHDRTRSPWCKCLNLKPKPAFRPRHDLPARTRDGTNERTDKQHAQSPSRRERHGAENTEHERPAAERRRGTPTGAAPEPFRPTIRHLPSDHQRMTGVGRSTSS